MKHKYLFVTAMLFALAFLCSVPAAVASNKNKNEAAPMKIVTSFYPMYIAVQNVIKEVPGITAVNLTTPNTGCLHDYQLTPQDLISLSGADAFVINGGGIESFLDAVKKNYPDLNVILASENIEFFKVEEEEHAKHEEEHGHDHEHGEENAHIWMDISKYGKEVENIAEELSKLDEKHRALYEKNAESYIQKLKPYEEEAKKLVSNGKNKNILVFHDAFVYFADKYGLKLKGVVEIDENTAFGAGEIAKLAGRIREEKIGTIFVEKQYGRKIADALSKETGVTVCELDSLVTGEGNLDSYEMGMKHNLEVLREALS